MLDRRTVLRTGVAAMAAAPLSAPAWAASDPSLTVTELPGGLHLISGAGGAVVAARGPQGAVMVDCGQADKAEAVQALVLQKTGAKTVSTLFNTCWRLEQTGGNDRLAASGAKILAHENTRLWMGTEIPARWENKVYPPRAPAARPTQTIFQGEGAPLALGPEKIEWGYLLQAHTDGDIYVFFRKANVLVVGGAVAGKGWPTIDWSTNGWYGGMIRGLETLTKLADDKTVIVPSDGVLLTKADLVKQHDMHMAIMTRLQTMMEGGLSTAEVLKGQPAAAYVAERGDPNPFLTQAFKSFWGNVRQFKAV